MLKHFHLIVNTREDIPAAFRRLCVETAVFARHVKINQPAAFRRLCVETLYANSASA